VALAALKRKRRGEEGVMKSGLEISKEELKTKEKLFLWVK
jgi:hypothetical protein